MMIDKTMMMMMMMTMTLMAVLMMVINRLVVTIHLVMFWRASAALEGNTLVPSPDLSASELSTFTSAFTFYPNDVCLLSD